MKKVKRADKKYPLKIILSNGKRIIIPKQSNFSNSWLRYHGCSLMAEYVALQYIGIHKYPIHLLKWHKSHTPNDVKAKVTVKGVSKGINRLAKGKGTAKYYTTPTTTRIKKALSSGAVVIMEEGGPIHSITLIQDNGKNYIINYGNVKRVDVNSIVKKATHNDTYRGMVIVKKV